MLPAARDREVRRVLIREDADGDAGLACLLALRVLRGGVGGLGSPTLGGDRVTAEVGEPVDRGSPIRLHEEGGLSLEVGDEVDDLLALLVVGKGRHAEVVLAGGEPRDDAVEGRDDDLDLEAHDPSKRLGEVGVHALDGLPVGADELVRRVVASEAMVSVPFDLMAGERPPRSCC